MHVCCFVTCSVINVVLNIAISTLEVETNRLSKSHSWTIDYKLRKIS